MRSDSGDTDHFDLLPFIAILMCVLGCLLLVTVSMSTISMGIGANEVWIPAPSDPLQRLKQKQAILCEWDGHVATFHYDRGRVAVAWTAPKTHEISFQGQTFEVLDDAPAGSNSELKKQLDDLKAQKDTRYVLLAIRPSGFANFDSLSSEFRRNDITIGYEPISQSRPLELGTAMPSTTQPTGR